jgi:hypothetical protein
MITDTIKELERLLIFVPPALRRIPEPVFAHKPQPGKWSRKEILGHLIDSAANNHQRFIRARYENTPFLVYNQDRWNELNYYAALPQEQLITFWTAYNQHLLELMKRIPESEHGEICDTGGPGPVTLGWLINDYLAHLKHHLEQIIDDWSTLKHENQYR